MADENIPTQYFHVRDLPTKAVTLYPARAHIVREVTNISLKPGQNEIELYGFAPTVDEQSLQIEGIGESATITDITVSKVPNKDDFEDIHGLPEEVEDDSESEYHDSDDDSQAVKQASQKYKSLDAQVQAAEEIQDSANQQLASVNDFVDKISDKANVSNNYAENIRIYDEQRRRIYAMQSQATEDLAKLSKQRDKAFWELTKAQKAEKKRTREADKIKAQEKRKKARELEEKRKEAARTRDELALFWPHMVYKVVVRLEAAIDTPGPSRRSSIGSITLAKGDPGPADKGMEKVLEKEEINSPLKVSLTVSYVTSGAYWTPRYDLSISSVQKTASIVYKAEVRNGTAETWKDTKIILSTSQTSFSGLEDKAPTMQPWRVNLSRYGGGDGLLSQAEIDANQKQRDAAVESKRAAEPQNKWVDPQPSDFSNTNRHRNAYLSNAIQSNMYQSHVPQVQQQQAQRRAHSSMMPSSSLARPMAAQAPGGNNIEELLPKTDMLAQSARPLARSASRGGGGFSFRRKKESAAPSLAASALGGATFGAAREEDESVAEVYFAEPDPAALDFEESAWEDCGLTASYDLPGTRTLVPSSLARRHKIATLNASNIILSHIAVPKLRAAAFLRAKIKNPSSSVTLIKGNAGITLDGSFLGTMALQQVSPNQLFTIPLGVDTAIQLSYPKPTLHRSTQGIFTKERAHVYTRSITVTNTKAVPVSLLVLDQVPISQDERLRIDVLQPRGLAKENDSVASGLAIADSKKPWGKATALFKKDGEICWTAEIEKGQACVLRLEYEAKMPTADSIVNVS